MASQNQRPRKASLTDICRTNHSSTGKLENFQRLIVGTVSISVQEMKACRCQGDKRQFHEEKNDCFSRVFFDYLKNPLFSEGNATKNSKKYPGKSQKVTLGGGLGDKLVVKSVLRHRLPGNPASFLGATTDRTRQGSRRWAQNIRPDQRVCQSNISVSLKKGSAAAARGCGHWMGAWSAQENFALRQVSVCELTQTLVRCWNGLVPRDVAQGEVVLHPRW